MTTVRQHQPKTEADRNGGATSYECQRCKKLEHHRADKQEQATLPALEDQGNLRRR